MAKMRISYHPTYLEHQETWRKAHDVYEGTGGFMDPDRPYLIAHPREWLDHSVQEVDSEGRVTKTRPNPSPSQPSRGLLMRRKLARYENIAEAIVGSVFGALFRQAPARTFGENGPNAKSDTVRPIQQWQANVDGRGTKLDSAMSDGWTGAAVFGHMINLVEPPKEPGATAADRGLPILRSYTPLDMPDWITDEDGRLISVMLLEAEPRKDFSMKTKAQHRIRVVNEESWALYDAKGNIIDEAEHGMGCLPIAILYGRRRPLTPLIGKTIMGDPNLYIDVYNLHSEERELLRTQTFGILNASVGPDGNIQEEQAKLGSQSGTANVLFSTNPLQYVSPDGGNVQVYHEHSDRLVRSVYRLAKAPWEGDSRIAESADSRIIRRDEQHQTLTGYVGELQRTDDLLVELAYRAMHGADGWEKAKKIDEPTTRYPKTFTPSDVDEVVERVLNALSLDLGPTATKSLKKDTARQLLPGLAQKELAIIDEEIDAQNIQTAEQKAEALMKATMARFGQKPENDDEDDDDAGGAPKDDDDKKGKAA